MRGLFIGTTVAVTLVALERPKSALGTTERTPSGSRDRISAAPHSIPGSLTHLSDHYVKALTKGGVGDICLGERAYDQIPYARRPAGHLTKSDLIAPSGAK